MDCSLLKKLKDAGFKQKSGFGTVYISEKERLICSGAEDHCACPACYGYEEGFVTEPTLEELIEACGLQFLELEKCIPNQLCAWRAHGITKIDKIFKDGDTPSIAVANLWLSIHGKEV